MGTLNLVSDGGKYALDFLTKEALLSQDVDFQQSSIEQKDLKQGHLKDASKNFMIDLIRTKLQCKNFYEVFLFMLQIRNIGLVRNFLRFFLNFIFFLSNTRT